MRGWTGQVATRPMLTDLLREFPDLAVSGYRRTSPPTDQYNCIAWAAGDNGRWWWPFPAFSYWPAGAPRLLTVAAFKAAYETIGYEPCETGDLEPAFEKIVIFSRGDKPTHAARQLPNGQWSSKLGRSDDIAHQLTGVVSGPSGYGNPTAFMRRARIVVAIEP